MEPALILAAGVWAGAINVIVGSGGLVTFPTLLLFGYPPLVTNVSNNIGMVAGGVSGVYGYRREVRDTASTLKLLSPASVLGALAGALLLLVLPAEAFNTIVPVLIAVGVAMVMIGPAIQRRSARQVAFHGRIVPTESLRKRILLTSGIFLLGVYGGYFGAAQGILLVGLMSMVLTETLQRISAIKNVLAAMVNAVAAITFIVVAPELVDWKVVGLIGVGAFVGGAIGARIGRRLPPAVLRAIIVVVGLVAFTKIVFFD